LASAQLRVEFKRFMAPYKVLVVEDNPVNAAFLEEQLRSGGLIPETVRGGLQALRHAYGRDFALAIVDVDIASEPSGVETADWLHRLYGVPAIVFSLRSEASSQEQAAKAGAAGYLARLDAASVASTVTDLLSRYRGDRLTTLGSLVREGVSGGSAAATPPAAQQMPGGFVELSAREWQIIRDLIEQPSAQAVAAKRQISPHTVHNHLKSIFKKLGIHSVPELLSLMLRVQRDALRA
jgi:DNA-binding NarL/FixJ family response regulator